MKHSHTWHRPAILMLLAAPVGTAGLIATSSSSSLAAALTMIDVPSPAGGHGFGGLVDILPNGNYVVVDAAASRTVDAVGAVSLYNGATNQLISTLTGSSTMDQVGYGGIVEVGGSNFLVLSPTWNNGSVAGSGAVTWVNGTTASTVSCRRRTAWSAVLLTSSEATRQRCSRTATTSSGSRNGTTMPERSSGAAPGLA